MNGFLIFIPAVFISWTTGTNLNVLFDSNRAEEMNNSQLTELEDDIQQQLARTEERVRDEVSVTPAVFMVCESL